MARYERVFKGDTAVLEATLLAEDGSNVLAATSVSWQVRQPDGTLVTGGPVPLTEAQATVVITDTTQPGSYAIQVTFALADGTLKSTPLQFEVVDPLEVTGEATTDIDRVVDRAWMKLEDLFDSELGGPHLRDRTFSNFDREKLKRFLPDALYVINSYYQPTTGFDESSFPWTQHSPLASQALLLEGMAHLIRSYVEQPTPRGGDPTHLDRRDYMQRWRDVWNMEEKRFAQMLDLFKRDQMGFGQTSVLVGGYGYPSQRYPRFMGSRYPFIYRW